MANLKTGLAYYNVDTDRYQDMRIKRLKKDFGCNGMAVYDYLLCEIYRDKGCFLVWDDSTAFDVAEYFGLKENTVKEIVNYCSVVGLFDKGLLCSGNILSSRSIQQRYIETCNRAKRKNIKIPEEYDIIREECDIIPEESPKTQEVCREVKRSKETIPLISPFHDDSIISISDLKKQIFDNETIWYESIAMKMKLKPDQIIQWLNDFSDELKFTGENTKSLRDFKSHFFRWLKIQLEKQRKEVTHAKATDEHVY